MFVTSQLPIQATKILYCFLTCTYAPHFEKGSATRVRLSYKSEAVMILDHQILLKSPPFNLTGWIRPGWSRNHTHENQELRSWSHVH